MCIRDRRGTVLAGDARVAGIARCDDRREHTARSRGIAGEGTRPVSGQVVEGPDDLLEIGRDLHEERLSLIHT